jgi:hypothetical protein
MCDLWIFNQKNKFYLQGLLVALAATAEGRVLAGAAEDGGIYPFLFETLQPLYYISRPNDQPHAYSISFLADNLRLSDIRGQCCNIWQPFFFVPRNRLDDSLSEPYSSRGTSLLSTCFPVGRSNSLPVGRQDGSIDICELSSGCHD